VLLDIRPVFWVADPNYILTAVGFALVTFLVSRSRLWPMPVLLIADAFGLALFTVIGVEKSLVAEAPRTVAVVLGVLTGVAGGMLRDVLTGEIPLVFQKHIYLYATAAMVGASVYIVLREMGIDVVAHQNVRANILRIGQPGPPNLVFRDEAAVFVGGVEIRMLYLGRGHTDGDTVVYFPVLKVVHAGDLIIDGMPVIDYAGGGSAVEFVRTIDALLEVDFDTLIPGHGRLMNREDVVAYRARFAEMNRRMRNLAKSGASRETVQEALYLDDLGWNDTVSTTTWATGIERYYDEMATQ